MSGVAIRGETFVVCPCGVRRVCWYITVSVFTPGKGYDWHFVIVVNDSSENVRRK